WSQNQPRGTPNSCNATSTTQDPMEIEDASQSSVVIDTTPTGCKSSKLFWTAEVRMMVFKPETHRAIAMALKEKFPKVDLDNRKVKPKFNQGFKKDYNRIEECKWLW
ncbi:uncharacterized protein VP01_8712g1, partial [Puccinia sorghi]